MTAEHLTPSIEHKKSSEILSIDELRQLGHLCRLAAERDDLEQAVQTHIETTGIENPNQHGKGFFVGEGDVPMTSDNVYRQVHAAAIEDLALTGVVRGQYTATGGERAQTSSHATYWHNGEDGRKVGLGGRYVIEASKAAAEQGWVTARDVKGVYTRDAEGTLHDITKL